MSDTSALLALALATLPVLAAFSRPAARPWLFAYVATLTLFVGLLALPNLLPGERVVGERWNWAGQLLALAGVLCIGSLLVRRAGMSWPEMGFAWRQRPGSLRPALWVSAAALSLHALALAQSGVRLPGVPVETWIYQATLPGLVEEAVFRGVLLGLLDRVFTTRRDIFAAPVGWGGLAVSLSFLALHGVDAGALLGVLPAALLYLWLRARTGSLVVPIAVHNLWNLSIYAAHL